MVTRMPLIGLGGRNCAIASAFSSEHRDLVTFDPDAAEETSSWEYLCGFSFRDPDTDFE